MAALLSPIQLFEITLDPSCCEDVWNTNVDSQKSGSDRVYKPGSNVEGSIRLVLNQTLHSTAVYLRAEGLLCIGWNEGESESTESKHRSFEEFKLDSNQKDHGFQKEYIILPKKKIFGGKGEDLPPGDINFPFKFRIPNMVPSSFTGAFGLIRFWVDSSIDLYPSGSTISRQTELIIHGEYNLNSEPSTMLPFEETKDDTHCCLCCTSGSFGYTINLPRTGYSRAEQVIPSFQLRNQTYARCSFTVKLKKEVHYESRKNKTIINTETLQERCFFVAPNTVERFCPEIQLGGSLPPSKLLYCDNIHFVYRLKYEVRVDGCNCDTLSNSVNLVIGDLAEPCQLPVMTQPVANSADVSVFLYEPADFTVAPESMPRPVKGIASKGDNSHIGYGGAQAHVFTQPAVQSQYPTTPDSFAKSRPAPPSYDDCVQISGGGIVPPVSPSAPPPSDYIGYSYQVQSEEMKKLS